MNPGVNSAIHSLMAVDQSRDASLEEQLAEQTARAEQLRFECQLARETQGRLEQERQRLERALADVRDDRKNLREQLASRDRLLDVIFRSRSWRWAQAARRAFGKR